jgi:serine/threonine protein kinase
MNDERWQQAKEVFNQALAHSPDEQAGFLSSACANDKDLRNEVESLLAAFRQADQFIEAPAVPDVLKLVGSNQHEIAIGRRVGQYEIIRKLGDGGMGAVYLAERADKQYQKQVAIKLIKFGFDNEFIVNRFLSERQILANLDHPNIARLIDGGTTAAGSPYLVMEYIEGLPIDEYCAHQELSIAQRLELFRTVCATVQYAHMNLVIHRDLKPSNILVTADGIPKLLDFGIAKLLTPELSASGNGKIATAIRLMTPEYASPEQIRGEPITTASDVYSLGVVLYELLTGRRPYKLKRSSGEEIERAISTQEAEKPSVAISRRRNEHSAFGHIDAAEPQKVARSLRGDLDNIVLMALRKEPRRRYESAAQFSADIQRHLEGLPVIARKDTFRYRASKFVRRNRLGVAAAAIVLLSLVGGIVATAWQARAARQEKAKAESINAFLEQMLNYSNPVLSLPGDSTGETTMTQVLDEAAKRLKSGEFANQPEVKAEMERIIGNSYYGQGRYALGGEHLQEYVELERRLYGEEDPRALAASSMAAALLFGKGEMAEAEKLFREVLPAMRIAQQEGKIKAETLLNALVDFAHLRRTQGDSREAETLFREALALSPQVPAESRYSLGVTRSTLASTLADQGKFDEAIQTAREAVTETRQREGAQRPDLGFSLTVLGGFLIDRGDFAEADAVLHEAETIFRKLLNPSHLWLGDNLRNQAISFYRQNRFVEAQNSISETLKIYRESFGVHYDNYPTALITQGLILNKTGKSKEGEAILREAVKLRTESLPKEHFWVAVANSALGECLTTQKRFSEAEPLLVQSYGLLNSRLGKGDPRTIEASGRLVTLYNSWGKPEQAEQYRTY